MNGGSRWPEWMRRTARYGLVAKGVLYGTLGILALRLAIGFEGEEASQTGAIQTIARQPLGQILLAVLAVGLAGYAGWRLVQAYEYESDEPASLAWSKRAAFVIRAGLYGVMCVLTVQEFIGSAGGAPEESVTAQVLRLPFGVAVVTAIGAGIVLAGLYQGYRAVTRGFVDELSGQRVHGDTRWIVRTGVVGHAARLVVFCLAGGFLIRAAVRFDPDNGVGLDGALQEVVTQPAGRVLIALAAVGLVVYAVWCFVMARVAEVRDME